MTVTVWEVELQNSILNILKNCIIYHIDYTLPLDKLEIKGETLFDYQLKIADDYDISISIGNVKNDF